MPGGISADLIGNQLNFDGAAVYDDVNAVFAPDAEVVSFLAQLALPRSAGEIVIESANPAIQPRIDMNYYADAVDLKVMLNAIRRIFDIAANWPGPGKLGPWMAPPDLVRKHGYVSGARPSDAMLENIALHFSHTTYHLSCTCRIGSVVDPSLRILGDHDQGKGSRDHRRQKRALAWFMAKCSCAPKAVARDRLHRSRDFADHGRSGVGLIPAEIGDVTGGIAADIGTGD